MNRQPVWGMALALAAGSALAIEPEMAAEQVNVRTPDNTTIGGSTHQRFAQAFELHQRGEISHVMLPVGCQPKAMVRVTIEGVDRHGAPDGVVLAEQWVPGHVLDAYPTPAVGMRMVEFERPALLDPGTYAFTLARKGKYDCVLWVGPDGDSYAPGKAWFIADGNPPYWIEPFFTPGVPFDLAFQVYVRPR